MFAIYIDPLVCHTWAGYLLPECWGIAICSGVSLVLALSAATAMRLRPARS